MFLFIGSQGVLVEYPCLVIAGCLLGFPCLSPSTLGGSFACPSGSFWWYQCSLSLSLFDPFLLWLFGFDSRHFGICGLCCGIWVVLPVSSLPVGFWVAQWLLFPGRLGCSPFASLGVPTVWNLWRSAWTGVLPPWIWADPVGWIKLSLRLLWVFLLGYQLVGFGLPLLGSGSRIVDSVFLGIHNFPRPPPGVLPFWRVAYSCIAAICQT